MRKLLSGVSEWQRRSINDGFSKGDASVKIDAPWLSPHDGSVRRNGPVDWPHVYSQTQFASTQPARRECDCHFSHMQIIRTPQSG
jgi:hypothetical protein